MKNFWMQIKSFLTNPAFIVSVLLIGTLLGGLFYRLLKRAPVIGKVVEKVALVLLTLFLFMSNATAAQNASIQSAPAIVAEWPQITSPAPFLASFVPAGFPDWSIYVSAFSIYAAIGAIAVAGVFMLRRGNHAGRRQRRLIGALGAFAIALSAPFAIPQARAEFITAKGANNFLINPKVMAGYTNVPNFGTPMPTRWVTPSGTNSFGIGTNAQPVFSQLGTNKFGFTGPIFLTNVSQAITLYFEGGLLIASNSTQRVITLP